MNVKRPIYLPGHRSEDEKGSLYHPPPLDFVLYEKKREIYEL